MNSDKLVIANYTPDPYSVFIPLVMEQWNR